MDRKEFDKKFKEQNYTLKFYEPVGDKTYTTLNGMIKVVKQNAEFWSVCNSGIGSTIRNKCVTLRNQLDTLVADIEKTESNWNVLSLNLQQYINAFNLTRANNITFPVISYNTDIAKKAVALFERNPKYTDGLLKFYYDVTPVISDKDELFGVLEAYQFLHSEFQTEKIEVYEKTVNDVVTNFVAEVDEIQNRYNENTTSIEEHYSNLKSENFIWQKDKTKEIDELIKSKNATINELENLYDEKLKLQSPAKYWEDLEKNFKSEGKMWLWIAVGISVVTMIVLGILLYNLPATLDTTIENAGLNTIRGTLILTIMISIAIYLIRLMVKMSMSAYHLSRDAKERHQLSYFYLALLRDEGIKEEDRMVVLQSLFSRSDTGLIKGDSSPAFPIDSMVAQVAKNLTKG